MVRPTTTALLLLALVWGTAVAQGSSSLTMERKAYAEWLASAATSPLAAVAMQRLSGMVTLGPDTADIPLEGFGPASVTERKGAVTFVGPDGKSRPLPKGRPISMSPWTLQVFGGGRAPVLLVYGTSGGTAPGWYAVNPELAFTLPLEAASAPSRRRVLTLDGIDVEAETAGHVSVTIGGATTRLLVMRMPVPGTEETELQVYFRDRTNDHGTYPAGRFVELTPSSGGTYRLDFNRARNPFCAYSSVYPCPVPWSGNTVPLPIEAGEKYLPAKHGS
jgi:hypothetical protein